MSPQDAEPMRVTVSAHFAFPLQAGYEYITDPARWPEYWPGLIRVEPGSRWSRPEDITRLTLKLLGRPTTLEMTLRRVEPYRLIEYTSVQRGLPAARHERRFGAAPGGFAYRIVVDLEPRPGLRRPVDRFVVARAVERAAAQTVRNLEQRFAELSARDDHRLTVLHVARAIAPGWERQRARLEAAATPVREWLVRELAPRTGDTVLELAAGAGDTGLEAAAIVGGRGRLISTDVSPEMLAIARRRGADLGRSNVEHRVLDAEHLELDDDAVDGVLCRMGYMLMADPAAALAETRRVLRPGGRLALSVWGAADRNPWMTILARTLIAGGHVPPPEPGAGPDPFSLASDEGLRALLEAAGYGTVRTEAVPVCFTFSDVGDYLSYATDTAGTLVLVLQGLSEADLAALASQLEPALAPFATDGSYALPGLALNAVAS